MNCLPSEYHMWFSLIKGGEKKKIKDHNFEHLLSYLSTNNKVFGRFSTAGNADSDIFLYFIHSQKLLYNIAKTVKGAKT